VPTTTPKAKRIDARAYNALADALAVIFWNKQPLARYLRGMLRDVPELLADLDFYGEKKRETAGRLVDHLLDEEARYQAVTIALMLNIAAMDSFPNLEGRDDSAQLISQAQRAVASLRTWTERHQALIDEHEHYAQDIAAAAAKAATSRAFSASIQALRDQFLAMHADASNPQARGKAFEGFLNELFGLFDLTPRAAYSLEREQIDGAFSFDTDDYILEARWWQEPIGREHLDVFKSKISRKGKNALGLYISVSGFTGDALQEYSASTPFITIEGGDLIAVLEERVPLDELLRRKKRHANETGECYFPASRML
jgi:Restriction endonuclease